MGLSMAVQLRPEAVSQIAVVVPAALGELDEANARFDEPAGDQTLPAEILRRSIADAVERPGGRRLVVEVEHFGQFALHPERHLVRLDDAFNSGMIRVVRGRCG